LTSFAVVKRLAGMTALRFGLNQRLLSLPP
jgi:hypothetical protein